MTLHSRVLGAILFVAASAQAVDSTPVPDQQEVVIWGKSVEIKAADNMGPTSVLRQSDLEAINITTTEDALKFEPSLIVRRRFIGDANGTLGLRGANMFQTSRSMVFADGVPLHYLLQSRWNGAPRWTMVSASEIAHVEVHYGPFSAEYSGNAMGGVVIMETALPQTKTLQFDSSYFVQDFAAYGFEGELDGHKTFLAVGNKLGRFSLYGSYNHLNTRGQPQTFHYATPGVDAGGDGSAIPAFGAVAGPDPFGDAQRYYGDTGIVDTLTDNLKFKLGYDGTRWSALLNLAYEDRRSLQDSANTYLRDQNGEGIWGGPITIDDQRFQLTPRALNVSEQQRDSLSAGLRIRGDISGGLQLEANLNRFDILNDETVSSGSNPAIRQYESGAEVAVYDDSGWQTAELKLRTRPDPSRQWQWAAGLRHERYQLNYDIYDSPDWHSAEKEELVNSSGGRTRIDAAYLQLNRTVADRWDIALGGRMEYFRSADGYFSRSTGDGLAIVPTPDNDLRRLSPKASVGLQFGQQWQARYSVARAYRFPIVEELFSQFSAYNAISQANPELGPERGMHQNLMLDRELEGGYLRVNIFHDRIRDVIESQTDRISGGPNDGVSVMTFVPVDQVDTRGVELILNQTGFVFDQLDIRFNVTWTNSEIVENRADPSVEGNHSPRMPPWRSNLLSTWHLSSQWQISANLQYADSSYGRLDNTDTARRVYGAQDSYTRLGLKANWQWTSSLRLGIGMDNVTNRIDYVAHPWPGRTVYLNTGYDYR